MAATVDRKPVYFYPDSSRVIARPFVPGDGDRIASIVNRVLRLEEESARLLLNQVLREFSKRHRNITKVFEDNFDNIRHTAEEAGVKFNHLSRERKLLIGSYFTKEYSIESAAFFNPSIVEDPYQGGLQEGEKRVIVSFRATGEGHLSSIAFRSGVVDRNNKLAFEPAGALVDEPEVVKRHVYEKSAFIEKLREVGVYDDVIEEVMARLGDTFIYGELQASIEEEKHKSKMSLTRRDKIETINWVASSHYEITFSLDTAISERVIFPISYAESNGIEDARFVRFTEDNGNVAYYATYTAYNGYTTLPKLLETKDFYHFKVIPMYGAQAKSKGMALFPRKINGKYAMLSRFDGVNNYIMFSDSVRVWTEAVRFEEPEHPWEYVQVGNCGSPIETPEGWLVITHGVGPMRRYALGATLLDLDDPTKVIGHLKDPLLTANDKEREGYVPNVVYSCGSILHNGAVIIPYGISDSATTFASVSLEELIAEMKNGK
ncbi:MAG TPA: glycoside hydrolase family 130 protein [Spirochaetia bacterium]|nr:glycoside hydrolase family 130 protein [Spirochaetia bacterium]